MANSISFHGRWFSVMLQPSRGATDWRRDGGLICEGLRNLGCDAQFVSLGNPRVYNDSPLIEASLRQISDADWWRQARADGVILYSWAAPRYEPVARAIKSAGI